MTVKWFGRIFGRKQKALKSVAVHSRASESQSIKKSSRAKFKEYSRELEYSFFASILNTSEEDFASLSEKQKVQAKKIARLIVNRHLTIDKLPRRPASLPMLINILKIDDLKYADISKVLMNDPALTAKIIQMANSPHFRLNDKKIETVEQAILLLGVGGLKKIITAAVMNPLFISPGKERAFYDKVWQWALIAGGANDKFAQKNGHSEGSLYLLGLLPALSFLIILQALQECETENPELGPIHPAVRKLIIMKLSLRLCLNIRAQWGLSEEYDRFIKEAELDKDGLSKSPLRDAIVLATYVFLEDQRRSPLSIMQLTNIMSRDADIGKLISAYLDQRN